jgi:PTS system fructose-specific IIC component
MAKASFGTELRKHLLNGVSYMIPFVVAGGILIAIGFAIGGIYVYKTPGFGADVFSWGKVAMGLMVPALAGYIAFSMADRPGIAPGFVGGMIAVNQGSGFLGGIVAGLLAGYVVSLIKKIKVPPAIYSLMPILIIPVIGVFVVAAVMTYILGGPVTWLNTTMTGFLNSLSTGSSILLGLVIGAMMAFDMGGPVNKAAYMFALAALESNNFVPMAAAFVGADSPQWGLALAMLLKPKKFSDLERKGISGLVVGGLVWVTEFAIPYAAADPIRVIPSLMIGSAVGSAVSMALGLSLMAPHGGWLVLPLANNPLLLLLALAVAVAVTAILLILLKPDLSEKQRKAE